MIDVRNPVDGFGSLRARVNALGDPAAATAAATAPR